MFLVACVPKKPITLLFAERAQKLDATCTSDIDFWQPTLLHFHSKREWRCLHHVFVLHFTSTTSIEWKWVSVCALTNYDITINYTGAHSMQGGFLSIKSTSNETFNLAYTACEFSLSAIFFWQITKSILIIFDRLLQTALKMLNWLVSSKWQGIGLKIVSMRVCLTRHAWK